MNRTPRVRTAVCACTLLALAGSALAAPPNDLAANAIVVNSGDSILGTTLAATTDGSAGCASSNAAPDVWYRITIPGTGQQVLYVDTCQATGGYDTALSVHTAAPGTSSNQIACDDDGCGNYKSQVAPTVEGGQTYWIRVAGWNGASGDFALHVSVGTPPPPPPPPPGCLSITVPTYPQSSGPDVIVGDLSDVDYYGVATANVPNLGTIDVAVMAVGTTSCNVGNRRLLWVSSTNYHPVIGQNLYRYKNGRYEQIGQSWLKHGFTALTQNLCGSCDGTGGPVLGINCSDPYVASLNGGQSRLGPKWQVNATTGLYNYPFAGQGAAIGNNVDRRLLVRKSDVDPAQNAGARYVVEGQYVTRDDAGYGNGANSASIREVLMSSGSTPINLTAAAAGSAVQSLTLNCSTYRREPGIKAWKALDPQVTLVAAEYTAPVAYVPPTSPPSGDNNSGANYLTPPTSTVVRFWVAARVTDNGDGTWHYEYAIQNINSDRAARSFGFDMNPLLDPVNVGFSAPFYHSGEVQNNLPWGGSKSTGMFRWSTNAYTGVTATDNATNALRWGTMYNYRFDLPAAPVTGTAKLYLFKPGTANEPTLLKIPGLPVPPPPCLTDVGDGVGNVGSDGFTTGADFDLFVQAFFTGQTDADGDLIADVTNNDGTGGPDGFLTGSDFDFYVQAFFTGGC